MTPPTDTCPCQRGEECFCMPVACFEFVRGADEVRVAREHGGIESCGCVPLRKTAEDGFAFLIGVPR